MAGNVRAFFSSKRNRRKLLLLALLLALLGLAAYVVSYFNQNKTLPLPTAAAGAGAITPPTYLYSISGTSENSLGRPIGVAVGRDGRVYVSDVTRQRIEIFSPTGKFLKSFDKIADGKNAKLRSPVHIAFDEHGDLYVSDRMLDSVYVFDTEGKYLRKYVPQDKKAIKGWSPLALAFDKDGRFYVSDVGDTNNHRVFVFGSAGDKLLQWGKTVQVTQASDSPGDFYFPNGIAVSRSGLIFIADGNNRRIQVFDSAGKFQYFIQSSGIPRGIWIDEKNQRLIVSDALAHQVDIYTLKGQKLVSFGSGGTGPGQFQFPNDVTLDASGRILIADRENHQVQVWGWPQAVVPAGVMQAAQYWPFCLTPLLLLPLLLLLRRRKFVVTPDFVDALVASEDVGIMEHKRIRWLAPEADHEKFYHGRVEGGLDLGELIHPTEHSESDARELAARMEIGLPVAALLSVAQRAKRLAPADPELRRLAAMLELEVFDREAFIERYKKES